MTRDKTTRSTLPEQFHRNHVGYYLQAQSKNQDSLYSQLQLQWVENVSFQK